MISTFPHMGDYYVPIEYMLKNIYKGSTVIVPPPITTKTLDIGSLHSPDFVCVPFKYNIGNLIEALDKGADYVFNAGCCSGCRLDFYGELQSKILHDMGYKYTLVNPFPELYFNLLVTFKIIKKAGKTANIFSCINTALVAIEMIKKMDKIDAYVRANVGFEVTPDSFSKMHKKFLSELKTVKTVFGVNRIYRKYLKAFKEIKLNKPKKVFRVQLIGELYMLMEPYSNYYIEKQLAQFNIEVHREVTLSYLMGQSHKKRQKKLKKTKGHLKYDIGSDGLCSVASALESAEKGYDGIIHLKPFGCMPEVSAMPMLINISKEYGIPTLFFSFDSQTSATGMKTRLEAFYDMLCMRKEN